MSQTTERIVGSFMAMSENGKPIKIIIRQEFTDITEFGSDTRQESPGRMWYITADGRAVNKINETTYEVLGNLEKYIVTRI